MIGWVGDSDEMASDELIVDHSLKRGVFVRGTIEAGGLFGCVMH